MSRIRRLKENRRKNTIKTTMASLALVLAIGSTPIMGTYALFTDTVDVPSDLSISTGDVDVRVDDGFNITIEDDYYVKDNEQIQKNHKFNIYNDGTLKQNISLSLDYNSNMNIDGYISYDLKFDNYHNRAIKPVKLSKQNIELRYVDNNELVELKKEEYISVTGTLTINEDVKKIVKDLDETDITFNLNVLSTQINEIKKVENKGFYDKEAQVNSIKIIDDDNDENVIPAGSIKVSANDTTIDINHETNDSNGYTGLDRFVDNYDQVTTIEYISGNGAFSKSKGNSKQATYQISPVDIRDISRSFDKTNTIVLKFNYEDGSYKKYMLDFRDKGSYGNRKLEAQVLLIESSKNSITENKQEEVELTLPDSDQVYTSEESVHDITKPDEVESPKVEVDIPSEPEVLEPPNEEVVVPSQSDIIAPSKEEIEIQE
ncbi:Uncharacterised protein [[Clostridium] sordellii]|uniref:hypothetical protein n=1 Tax=Paraclostridium sordellii TaxID=1505 RepID=UPI0005E92F2C|nr:hypothetical protein [Paeniclostridium sordellii]CEQ11065.1 Uncharacterised protein [[Clostridium] sordellii] [Paeniclostridium sordellii]